MNLIAFKPALVGLMLVASGPSMPALDIERICQSTVVFERNHVSLHSCRHDEREAMHKVRALWGVTSSRVRRTCLEGSGGSPSYTELMTCLDLDAYLRRERAELSKGRGRAPIVNGRALDQ